MIRLSPDQPHDFPEVRLGPLLAPPHEAHCSFTYELASSETEVFDLDLGEAHLRLARVAEIAVCPREFSGFGRRISAPEINTRTYSGDNAVVPSKQMIPRTWLTREVRDLANQTAMLDQVFAVSR